MPVPPGAANVTGAVAPTTAERPAVALLTATRRAVTRALAEDMGEIGDLTSRATVPAGMLGEAEIVAREPGVISGLAAVVETFAALDPRVVVEVHVADGESVLRDQVIAVLRGPMRSLLTGERTALNFLSHLSGVATATAELQALIEGTGCSIRDTRKTTPGLRLLEKAAVRDGGGENHRIGLYDAILVKENHLLAAGGVAEAIQRLRRANPEVPVQVEVETVEQVWRLLELGINDILLDNFSVEEVRHASARVDGRARLEVSGNLDARTVRAYAEAVGPGGRLAVGSITHSSPSLDLALDVVESSLPEPLRRALAAEAPKKNSALAQLFESAESAAEPEMPSTVGEHALADDEGDSEDDASPRKHGPFRQRRNRGD